MFPEMDLARVVNQKNFHGVRDELERKKDPFEHAIELEWEDGMFGEDIVNLLLLYGIKVKLPKSRNNYWQQIEAILKPFDKEENIPFARYELAKKIATNFIPSSTNIKILEKAFSVIENYLASIANKNDRIIIRQAAYAWLLTPNPENKYISYFAKKLKETGNFYRLTEKFYAFETQDMICAIQNLLALQNVNQDLTLAKENFLKKISQNKNLTYQTLAKILLNQTISCKSFSEGLCYLFGLNKYAVNLVKAIECFLNAAKENFTEGFFWYNQLLSIIPKTFDVAHLKLTLGNSAEFQFESSKSDLENLLKKLPEKKVLIENFMKHFERAANNQEINLRKFRYAEYLIQLLELVKEKTEKIIILNILVPLLAQVYAENKNLQEDCLAHLENLQKDFPENSVLAKTLADYRRDSSEENKEIKDVANQSCELGKLQKDKQQAFSYSSSKHSRMFNEESGDKTQKLSEVDMVTLDSRTSTRGLGSG